MTGVITSIPPLVEQPPGSNSSNPAGLPGVTYTAAIPTLPQTWTALQTFNSNCIEFAGSSSGNTFLNATAIASGTVILPAIVGSDTLLANNNVATVTNKSIDGLQNTLTNIPASAFGSTTGTGPVVLQTGPTLIAPLLGTPASGVLTNVTGLPISTGVAGLGAGIAAALAVNVGTAGAPVVNGGVLGTPSSGTATNLTGLPISTGISGAGTGVLAALAVNVGTAGSVVVNGGVLGTPSSGTATNLTGLPISTGVSGLAAGVAAFLATPSSANLRTALTDEVGTGAAYFVGGALGTPASGTATNLTGLPISTGLTGAGTGVLAALAVNVGTAGSPIVNGGALGTPSSGTLTSATGLPIATGVSGLGTGVATALAVNVGTAGAPVVNGGALGTPSSGTLTNATGLPLSGHTTQAAFTFVGNNTSGAAAPTAVDISALTAKASPTAADLIMISDQAASGAWKKVTVSALSSAGSVASLGGATGAITITGGNLPGTVLTMPRYDAAQTLSAGESFQVRSNIGAVSVPDVIVEDQKASGTSGGASTSGSWFTRDLNTLVRNSGTIASLSSNQVTLGAGTYYFSWSAPGAVADQYQTRIFNVTDTAVVAYGSAEYVNGGVAVVTRSMGSAVVTIAGSKAFRIEQRVTTTTANTGSLGLANAFGNIQTYSRLEITRLQ